MSSSLQVGSAVAVQVPMFDRTQHLGYRMVTGKIAVRRNAFLEGRGEQTRMVDRGEPFTVDESGQYAIQTPDGFYVFARAGEMEVL